MSDVTKDMIKLALSLGATEAEVYAAKGGVTTVETEHGDIGFAEQSRSGGYGIRLIYRGALGYSSTNDPSMYEQAVKAAIACARVRGKDPDLKGLPGPSKYKEVRGIFDKTVEGLTVDDCMSLAATMVEGAREDPGASVTFGKFSSEYTETTIVNSNGVEATENETAVFGYIEVIIKDGDRVSTAFDYAEGRGMDLDVTRVGASAAALARGSLEAKEIEGRTCDVLLGPYAFSDLIESTLLFSVNAESVQKGRSGLAGRIGKKIAADGLTIVDDGLIDHAMGSSMMDDEGTPSGRTVIVDDGVLSSFLYDSYTAGKEGRESTGNAIRASFMTPPKVGPRNICFEYPRCDVIKETDSGIYVNSIIGAHTANAITGDFSVECRNAFVVEDGARTTPVKSMMISGNMFDILNKIDGMSRDEKTVGAVICPTVKVKDVKVTPGA
jgi:PmbA protein